MRILAIRGKNLASLEGEFEVDFTAEPLKSAGIFAITGSTGSGKSTLLDAICLALFNEVPRISRAEDAYIADVKERAMKLRDPRNILRRGTADGYAEVDFVSLAGDKYRARWSVRRARDKVDGLLRSAYYNVWQIPSGNELQGSKTELFSQVSKLIGLTFNQFTRAVLLAQGDFTTFLKAGKNEKAELLEKLTGIDIYSRISVKIYENTLQAKSELALIEERIKSVVLLPEEQIVALTAEKGDAEKETGTLDSELKILSEKRQWLQTNEQLVNSVEAAQNELTQSITAIKNAKPRFDYLTRVEGVQEIRDAFRRLENDRKQLSSDEMSLKEQQAQSTANNERSAQAKIHSESCRTAQNLLKTEWQNIEPQIKAALKLDVQIDGATRNLSDAGKEISQIAEQIAGCEEEIAECDEKICSIQKTQNELLGIEIAFLQSRLVDNEPCPVCGSTHHPLGHGDTEDILVRAKGIIVDEIEQLAAKKQERTTLQQRLTELTDSHKEKKAKQTTACSELEELKAKRKEMLGGAKADDVEKSYREKLDAADKQVDTATESQNNLARAGEKIAGIISQLTDSTARLKKGIEKSDKTVSEWLSNRSDGLTWDGLAELLTKDNRWLVAERGALDSLKNAELTAKTKLAERRHQMDEHQKKQVKPTDGETEDYLTTTIEDKTRCLKQKQERITEIGVLFTNHKNGQERIKQFEKEHTEQRSATENWLKLNDLFGSASGDKFKVLAQGYTLDVLLDYANIHLKDISQRYLLQRISPDSLSLQVVDLDMLSEVRSVHSLSGGESFLISLSLALGLSSLSSNRMRVESLFIDEGFGSLDADTLRVTMDALERLQTQGRKIGVISHVAEMTERIPTQIQVIKTVNGKSRIEIKG